jgi:bacterioferritin-associated ferredoxin
VIVCSCNVLSDKEILATLANEEANRPRTPAQAYSCLGCAPRCGRCVPTVRALLREACIRHCEVGCPTCPAIADGHHDEVQNEEQRIFPMAAE